MSEHFPSLGDSLERIGGEMDARREAKASELLFWEMRTRDHRR